MGGSGGLTSSDGSGGRVSRFFDAVVTFVVGVFQPVSNFLATHILPANSRQHNNQNRDRSSNDRADDQYFDDNHGHHQQQQQQEQQEQQQQNGDQHSDPASMQGQLQGQRTTNTRVQHPYGPKDVGANEQFDSKVALPQASPAVNGHAKDNLAANGGATKTALGDVTNTLNNLRTDAASDNESQEDDQDDFGLPPAAQPFDEPEDPILAAEREIHHGFMEQALDMARLALKTNETPVGCVLVHNGRVVARGMNATNVTRNGTRHAELMALTALLSFTSKADVEKEQPKKSSKGKKKQTNRQQIDGVQPSNDFTEQDWGDVEPKDGHIYPYGQKLHPAPVVDRSLLADCTLYVTVEPCVMCASMLRQFGIKKVFFGAVNDKFGGTGGVFCIHMNSEPALPESAPETPIHRPIANQLPRPILSHKFASTAPSVSSTGSQEDSPTIGEVKQVNGFTFTEPPIPISNMSKGHGGNVEDGFEAEGGWRRDEAVNLLRQFYVQENGRAPVPRKKEGRAARLAAMMESQGLPTEGTALEAVLQQERDALERTAFEDSDSDETIAGQDDTNGQADVSNYPFARYEAYHIAETEAKPKANDTQPEEHTEVAPPSQQDGTA